MDDILFDLYYKSAHRIEELEQTIEELQGKLKYRKNENIRLAEENKKFKSCLTIADNDYKKCYAENVRLAEENNKLQCDLQQSDLAGRWIEHFDESGKWYECDQCHTDWGGAVNYCPNCGAKMYS